MFHCGQSLLANVFIVLSRIIIIDPWQTLVPMDHDWLKDVEKVQASLHQNRKQQKVKKKVKWDGNAWYKWWTAEKKIAATRSSFYC